MLLKRIAVENVRSFRDRQELLLDGNISILIGPNGGGKTNLLDAAVIMLRRYLLASRYPHLNPTSQHQNNYDIRGNDQLSNLILEKHSRCPNERQIVEVEVQVTSVDLENMRAIKRDGPSLQENPRWYFHQKPWDVALSWDITQFNEGDRFVYKLVDGGLADTDGRTRQFLEYLQLFEFDNGIRAQAGLGTLQMPMIYLPVNRAMSGFQSNVSLAGYNDLDQKRAWDATSSRSSSNIISLAVGRLAQKFRHLQEDDNQSAKAAFYADPDLVALSSDLKSLGYDWELATVDVNTNTYDVRLKKQGSSFLVSNASSGERELLTYLFAIHALRVKHALILVDEPELHLHPRWQKSLFGLFERLAVSTGNQFLLATHSPTFVSPASIQYVSRVYSRDQQSHILRLKPTDLPNAKHLFNAVNSQNNERVFFTDRVVLVEGLSDRIVLERLVDLARKEGGSTDQDSLEIVSVGGKGLFPAYKQLLDACGVESVIVADLDYIEQVGTPDIKKLLVLNASEIKKDVIENVKSLDGASLVAEIDKALVTNNWSEAQDVWEYIKSHRRVLKSSMSDEDRVKLDAFLAVKRSEGTHILSLGAIEDYLPDGYRAKDIGKLIDLVNVDDFWDRLRPEGKAEMEALVRSLLSKPL